MSVIGSNILAGASGQVGYNLTKSLRFRSSASAYLNRTPASASNRQTWTWSGWVKRGKLGGYQTLFSAGTSSNTELTFHTTTDSYGLDFGIYSGSYLGRKLTSSLYRDCSAWYHVVATMDTTNATAGSRMRLYVNGVQVTAFSVSTDPTQNTNTDVNNTVAHNIANNPATGNYYFDGYLAEVNFIDGQALTPSSFGETSTTTGVWIPKKYTGSYGTNGFYLPFTDTTSTSTLGTDFSGNSNTWTVNNISLTSGSTYDSMNDVPTLTSATTANYCVLNPLNTLATLSSANLKVTNSAASNQGSKATFLFPTTSLWYCECVVAETTTASKQIAFGLGTPSVALNISTSTANSWGLAASDSSFIIRNGSQSSTLSFGVFTAGTVLQLAVDLANSRAWLGINNTWYNSTTGTDGNPSAGTNPTLTSLPSEVYPFVFALYQNSCDVNFGQRPFSYTPPTGFVALNTFNLPTPTIGATASTTANKYFDTTLYTGTGATQTITNSGSMQPDWLWIKVRSTTGSHALADSVRGSTIQLASNNTDDEITRADTVTSFNSNGFSLGANTTGYSVNLNTATYVAWQWRASNATAVTNTAGSITSTVSANTTAGFSIVTYTGTGSTATVGHGLGVAPSMFIIKRRNAAGNDWAVYHISTSANGGLALNDTRAYAADSAWFNNTAPTSSVFTVSTSSIANASGGTYVAYCFAQVAGYSAFGSYTGNGSTDGPFVFTGFKPAFVIIKNSTATGEWHTWDYARSPSNVNSKTLRPNNSNAETDSSDYSIDFLSNGFKIRNASNLDNQSGQTFIYMVFAEFPQKFSNAR